MTKSTRTLIPRKHFLELLSATHNINDACEPGSMTGKNATAAALQAVKDFYDKAEDAKPGEIDGMLIVARLLVEVSCADKPDVYSARETLKSTGDAEPLRHEFSGAGILLPAMRSVVTDNFGVPVITPVSPPPLLSETWQTRVGNIGSEAGYLAAALNDMAEVEDRPLASVAIEGAAQRANTLTDKLTKLSETP